MPKPKTINIKKPCYAMATQNGKDAEITMYGDIYEQQPTDWFGNKIEGQFILLSEFLEDLKQIEGCKSLTIRMHSYGGDAAVSTTIHNRLRELSRNGVKTTCIVDGVAMSGGSLIMCACDTVKANPSSMIMIHKCWTFMFGGYNADELREMASENDVWDKMQVEIYQRKTGLSNAVILHMMKETTYMTGRDAKEKGFVDELLEDAEPAKVAASGDGNSLIACGRKIHLAPGMFLPDFIPTAEQPAAEPSAESSANNTEHSAEAPVQSDAAANINNLPEHKTGEGGKNMTPEELRAQYPEAVAAIEAAARQAAVNAERERQQEIDTVAGLFNADLVAAARYGETACSAQELSYRAAQQAAKAGAAFMADLAADASASNASEVGAAAAPEDKPNAEDTPESLMAAGAAAWKELNKKEEK